MARVVVFALGVTGDSGLKYFGCRRLDDIVKLAGGTIDLSRIAASLMSPRPSSQFDRNLIRIPKLVAA
jgi:hypothetical protein